MAVRAEIFTLKCFLHVTAGVVWSGEGSPWDAFTMALTRIQICISLALAPLVSNT